MILGVERRLVFGSTGREIEKPGHDIESRVPGTGKFRFIKVKGKVTGVETMTVTQSRILYLLNKPDDFILVIVGFNGESHVVHYVRRPFRREPDFGVRSENYGFVELLEQEGGPR